MKRQALLLAGLGLTLAACGDSNEPDTYFCLNGPDLVAAYNEEGVTLFFNDDTVHKLTRPDPSRPNFYANAKGMTWSVGINDARLDFDRKSFLCDEIT